MKKRTWLVAFPCVLIALLGTDCAGSVGGPQPEQWTLDNGIRIVTVPMPGSRNVSIFTYLPMGLVSDDAGRTQWSHVIEHLVIRSTHPTGSQEVNAETLPDHMRLDFYGTVDNWKQGVSFHADWLRGIPFSEEVLGREKPRVNAECDMTAKNLATHKFALAAWAQGFRHAQARVAVKGDVNRATLNELQQYRDERLVVPDKTVVCIVGGVDSQAVKPVVEKQLATITSAARTPARVQLPDPPNDITWDLPTRHLVLTWPMPGIGDADYSALYVAAALLQGRLFNDSAMKSLAGNVLVGADLTILEGTFFYVNAVLQPGVSFDNLRLALDEHLLALAEEHALAQGPMFARQLSFQLAQVMDPAIAEKQAPHQVSRAMIEGNIGLQWGMKEFQYGSYRPALAEGLSVLTAQDIQQAVTKHLASEKSHALTIRPADHDSPGSAM